MVGKSTTRSSKTQHPAHPPECPNMSKLMPTTEIQKPHESTDLRPPSSAPALFQAMAPGCHDHTAKPWSQSSPDLYGPQVGAPSRHKPPTRTWHERGARGARSIAARTCAAMPDLPEILRRCQLSGPAAVESLVLFSGGCGSMAFSCAP